MPRLQGRGIALNSVLRIVSANEAALSFTALGAILSRSGLLPQAPGDTRGLLALGVHVSVLFSRLVRLVSFNETQYLIILDT